MNIERNDDTILINIDSSINRFFVNDNLINFININKKEDCGVNTVIFNFLINNPLSSSIIDLMISLMVLKYSIIVCHQNINEIESVFSSLGIYNYFIFCKSLNDINKKGESLWEKKPEKMIPVNLENQGVVDQKNQNKSKTVN